MLLTVEGLDWSNGPQEGLVPSHCDQEVGLWGPSPGITRASLLDPFSWCPLRCSPGTGAPTHTLTHPTHAVPEGPEEGALGPQ